MTLPNENPKLKRRVSSSVEFRNKCSQHELSTARVKIGQLLVPAESSPHAPSQPPRVECQTLPSGLESGRQAQPPSLGAYLPPGGCSQLDGSAHPSRCWAASNRSATGPGAANIYSHAAPAPHDPRARSPQGLACEPTWPSRSGQVMRIRPSVFAYPQRREGN